jgi:hypothetical protein
MEARSIPLRAARSWGRKMMNLAAFALAGNPPQLSVLLLSAALGFLLDLLPARPTGISTSLRLD